MGRGRKKKSVHPGQLCHSSAMRYSHTATWDEDLRDKMREITGVSGIECICRACEGDFKLNNGIDGHRFRWVQDPGNFPGSKRCIVASCTETGTIVNTGIATKEKIAEILHEEVREGRHLLTPLCMTHYKQLHRLLHTDDHMYTEKRCCTCNAQSRQQWISCICKACRYNVCICQLLKTKLDIIVPQVM